MSNLSFDQVIRHVRNPDEGMRLNAVRALFALGTPEAGQGLRVMAQDPSPNVRRLAVHAYQQLEGRLGGPGSIPQGLPPQIAAPQGGGAVSQSGENTLAQLAKAGTGEGSLSGLARPAPQGPPSQAGRPAGGGDSLAGLARPASGGGGGLADLVRGGTTSAAHRAATPAVPPPAPAPVAAMATPTPAPRGGDPEAQAQLLATFAQGLRGYQEMETRLQNAYETLSQLRARAIAAGAPEDRLVMPGRPGAGAAAPAAEAEASGPEPDSIEAMKAAVRTRLRPVLTTCSQAAVRAERRTPPVPAEEIPRLLDAAAGILEPCTERLVAFLTDTAVSGDLRDASARAMGAIRGRGGLDAILGALSAGRVEAAFFEALGSYADPRALPILRDIYSQDRYATHKQSVCHALTRIPGKEADQFLTQLLADPDPSIRTAVVTHLGEAARPGFLEPLLKHLGTAEDYFGMALFKSLANYAAENPKIAEKLAAELARVGSDDRMAVAVIGALGRTRNAAVLPTLEPYAKSRENRVRKAAIEAICGLDVAAEAKTKVLRPILIGDKDVRWKAETAVALAKVGDPKGLQTLKDLAGSRDRNERLEGLWGLNEVAPPDLLELVQDPARQGDVEIRTRALRALGGVKAPQAMEILSRAAKEADVNLRGTALEALGRLGASAHPKLLELMANEYEPALLATAIRAVGDTDPQPPSCLPKVLRYTEHVSGLVRTAFVATAQRVMCDDAKEPLLALVRDPEVKVRLGALEALWCWGEMRVVFSLYDMLIDPDLDQRRFGANGIEEVGRVTRKLADHPHAGRLVAALRARPGGGGP